MILTQLYALVVPESLDARERAMLFIMVSWFSLLKVDLTMGLRTGLEGALLDSAILR